MYVLLLNIRMNTNLHSRCVVRNSNKNKLIWCNLVPCLKKQGNITTNFDAINILAKQCIEAVARRCPVKKVSLGAVHMEIVFLLLSRLPGKKILFPRVHIRNISPPGRDLFWQAVRGENFWEKPIFKMSDTNLKKNGFKYSFAVFENFSVWFWFYVWWEFYVY